MTGLPQGWALATLADLGEWSSGGTPSRSNPNYFGGDIPFVKTGDLRDQTLTEVEETLSASGLANSSAKIFPSGTLLIAMYGATIGRTARLSFDAATNQACAVLLENEANADSMDFVWKYLRSQTETLKAAGKGGAQPNISQTVLKEYPIPLPPLPEQRRIVCKLDTLSARSSTARTHLTAIEKLVERYKSGVTALAVSGALTESFRRLNSLPEPTVATFGEWFDYKGGSQPPKSTFHSEPAQGRIRLLQIRDFASDDKAVYIDDNGKWPRCSSDDIMVGRYGASVGKILSGKAGAYNVALVKWVFDRTAFDPAWIYALLKSDVFQRPIAAVSRSAQDGFNKGDVENIEFLKPSITEQHEIVRRIETAFAKIDRLKAEAAKALKLLGHLDGRILAKAFAGDLVPQDPDDEPAETLLARIRAERRGQPSTRRKRRKEGAE